MKPLEILKLIVICLAAALNSGLAIAADCPRGDYILNTQDAIDSFPADCDTITGHLQIKGGGITNLNGLANISVIGADLRITENPGIRFLRLPGLTRVDGDFEISWNKALVSLDGLTRLSKVGGFLSIYDNQSLGSLDGLQGLTTAGGVSLGYATPIRDLHGLHNLREVEKLFLSGPELQNIDALRNIKRLDHLSLTNLDVLENIDALRNVTELRTLTVYNTDRLIHLDALSNITAMSGLYIERNNNLRHLEGLRNVRDLSCRLKIIDNPALLSIPLESLRRIRSEGQCSGVKGLMVFENHDWIDCSGLRRVLGHPVGPPYDGVTNWIDFRPGSFGNCGGSAESVVPPLHRPEEMAEVYIGFLGRAPDPAGLVYWTRELRRFGLSEDAVLIGLKKLANDITASAEWFSGIGRHNPLTQSGAEAIVAAMYINLFSRPATASDLEYWSYDLTTRYVTAAEMAVLLINGAKVKRNRDFATLIRKHEAALYYVARVDDSSFDRGTARLAVKDVDSDSTLQDSKDASDKL